MEVFILPQELESLEDLEMGKDLVSQLVDHALGVDSLIDLRLTAPDFQMVEHYLPDLILLVPQFLLGVLQSQY